MATGTPASKQAYVDDLREGIFNLDRQLRADRSRADAIAGNVHLQNVAAGSQALTADWSPGPAISEGSSHGAPPEVVEITIDSPDGVLPFTHRPDQESEGEASPAQPESEPTEGLTQSDQAEVLQLDTSTAGATPQLETATAGASSVCMDEVLQRDAETRRAWSQNEVSGHIEAFGQVVRGASGDTSSSSGDSDLPDLSTPTEIYDDLLPAPLPAA